MESFNEVMGMALLDPEFFQQLRDDTLGTLKRRGFRLTYHDFEAVYYLVHHPTVIKAMEVVALDRICPRPPCTLFRLWDSADAEWTRQAQSTTDEYLRRLRSK